MAATEICPKCHNPFQPDNNFCSVCGEPRLSAHLKPRVSTGIVGEPNLDELFEGGFEDGKTYLIAGGAGTGKTIFGLQYLLQGIRNGESGIYITSDDQPERLVKNVLSFGWNVGQYLNHKLLILPIKNYFVTKGWYTDINKIMNAITSDLKRRSRQISAKRLVIDPIEPLIPMNNNEITWIRDYIKKLVFSIENEVRTTNIITSRLPVSDATISGMEIFPTSGIIILELSRVGDQFLRTFSIREMKWTNCQPTVCKFEIESNKGIVLKGIYEENRFH